MSKGKKRRSSSRRKKPAAKPVYRHPVFLGLMAVGLVLLAGWGIFKMSENGTYTVYDPALSEEPLSVYHHFSLAENKLNTLSDSAYILNENGQIAAINQGLVLLHTKPDTENTLYTVNGSDETGYTNGAYGEDALYLDARPGQVLAQISGVQGWFDLEDVELLPWHEQMLTSYYMNVSGQLVHSILTDTASASSSSCIISLAPDFMPEGQAFYSYDGSWFYTDFLTMKDDVNTHAQAVNETAWYNPWQYMPHHSSSSLTAQQVNDLLAQQGLGSGDLSVLYDLYPVFMEAGSESGVNPAMMLALAMNESAWGTSEYAWSQNNLFGHGAYDENPDSALMYASLADCIRQHAQYFINEGYGNPEDERWYGSWFGNKASGMNVCYASDPYWGEKAASFYYLLQPDLEADSLWTFQTEDTMNVYSEAGGRDILYTIAPGQIFSCFVENEDQIQGQTWYDITSDIKNIKSGSYESWIEKK